MIEAIQAALADVEQTEDVRILLAVESGSRAWGFESVDSDWDVRFIYVRRRDWYLSIAPGRDVIERMLPDDIDLAGWDLPKALGLFAKSNPALLEWLRSPLVYRHDAQFVAQLRSLEPSFLRLEAGLYHYRSMVKANYETYVKGDQVPLKKYLYCLRPLLAAQYFQRTGEWPPMEFAKLVTSEVKDPDLKFEIERLVEAKRLGGEIGLGKRVPMFDRLIESFLATPAPTSPRSRERAEVEPLNMLFRAYAV